MNRRLISALASILALLCVGAVAQGDTPIPMSRIQGIYLVMADNMSIDDRNYRQALASPSVDGAYVHQSWNQIESQPGKFDWSFLDAQVAAVVAQHKLVSISIRAGADAPQWLYKEGAQRFHTIIGLKRRREFCTPLDLPVPWDPIFLKEWTNLIRAFGAHYANNPNVVIVKITGISYRTDETNLPHLEDGERDSSVTGTTCQVQDDISAWQKAGYTSTKVNAAFQQIALAFGAAFPHQYFAVMTNRRAFPPIGDHGQRDDDAASISTTDFFDFGRRTFGQRFIAQNNGLSELWAEPGILAFGRVGPIAFQGAGPVTGGHHCRGERHQAHGNCGGVSEMQNLIANGLHAHVVYLELFAEDIINPDFASAFAKGHTALHSAR